MMSCDSRMSFGRSMRLRRFMRIRSLQRCQIRFPRISGRLMAGPCTGFDLSANLRLPHFEQPINNTTWSRKISNVTPDNREISMVSKKSMHAAKVGDIHKALFTGRRRMRWCVEERVSQYDGYSELVARRCRRTTTIYCSIAVI